MLFMLSFCCKVPHDLTAVPLSCGCPYCNVSKYCNCEEAAHSQPLGKKQGSVSLSIIASSERIIIRRPLEGLELLHI